jgi:flavin-dependent dehydrogenase
VVPLQFDEIYDAVVIGGGPAGATAGGLLAKNGRRVLILEKEKFPRFRVGESMLAASGDTLQRLGVTEKLTKGDFLIKYGGEIGTACGQARQRFYFRNARNARHATSFQVERAHFDQVLLEHARELGCEVREQTVAESIELDREGVTVVANGRPQRARYLIDCSGRNCLLANRFELKEPFPELRKFSVFAYFENVRRPEGKEGTMTRMIRAVDCWLWMIPMTRERTSIGVVMDIQKFRSMNLSPEEALERCLAEQPEVNEWMSQARRYSPVYATSDFSYRVKQLVGDRWLVAGDAAGFLDPVFSSGVHIALTSGDAAAQAVERALRNPRSARAAFGDYQKGVNCQLKTYLKMVRCWYKQEFIDVFLQPRELLGIVPAVTSVLSGNVPRTLGAWWRLKVFFLLVYLQGRTGKLVSRLPLDPRPS